MSDFENDYIMRQIKGLAATVARLLFNRETKAYTQPGQALTDGTGASLAETLRALVALGELDRAENLLFETAKKRDVETLYAALDFYQTLESLSDEDLKESGFTHDEIARGLTDLFALYGIDIGWIAKKP